LSPANPRRLPIAAVYAPTAVGYLRFCQLKRQAVVN